MTQKIIGGFRAKLTPPGDFPGGRYSIPLPVGAADAFMAIALAGDDRLVLAVVPGIPDADRLADDLTIAAAETPVRVLAFPPRLSDDRTALGTRLKTVAALRAWSISPRPTVVVASAAALASSVPRAATVAIELSAGAISFKDLCRRLTDAGYRRVPQVEQPGDFSVRGCIVDAWSAGDEFPVRAEFFGEDLESLRSFNPATQVSVERLDAVTLMPAREANDAAEEMHLVDLLPPDSSVLFAIDHNSYTVPPRLDGESIPSVFAGAPAPAGVPSVELVTSPLPGFAELGADEAHHPELFEEARARLDRHLAAAKKRGDTVERMDELSGGFEFSGFVVVTKADRVFTKRKVRSLRSAAVGAGPRLNDFEDLEPGEYVVHVDHGVGRYVGSSEIVTDSGRTEVFNIEYADGALLHVPASHAHLLSRYVGVKGEQVRVHRLDGRRWSKDKADAQKAVTDLAAALLETQARRETIPGFAYDVNCEGLDAFEAAFPYEETADQTSAIAAVKRDMAASKPMDRLVCGDAGYGKTEVAMRAAYIAALNGKQVAVLAPTTVLAEQHFETFTSRFDGTPVRIESLSRFQSAGTHSGTFKRLASGACDIVIGTHALFSRKTVFHDLGLIVIDEEQRFGVRHKEFLKRLRETADVLTLSATPIPRTLYLSMTGARDLSLLRTPPHERVAVDTKIVTDSDEIVVAAIEAELARGGQVFFLHNRVMTIDRAEKRLKALFANRDVKPRITVAHGQMDTRTLARKMRDFERGESDILLSTTIVESGIDIPRANTIIVDHAEMFGLADLYQLRGRVGRSVREGHAVFLLPTGGLVDSDARERLEALRRHGGLGSGFNLAVRDLELRGAGNLLGSQQSGHIAAVGFGLYCQLLTRTIALMKGEKVRDVVDVRVNVDFTSPCLPYEYIEEEALRLNLLRRFAGAQDRRTLRALAAEMEDRFGPMPAEAKTFVRLAELRIRCAEAGYGAVDAKDNRAIFYGKDGRTIARVVTVHSTGTDRRITELIRAIGRTDDKVVK